MIRDLLVHIPTERPAEPVIDASISLAGLSHAHLDAIAAEYIRPRIASVADGGAAIAAATAFDVEQKRASELSAAALAVFEREARKAQISYECHSIQDLPAEAAFAVATAARLYDLTIVLQPDTSRKTFDNTTPTEVLLQAGGPVLFVPHIFHGALNVRRIGICWDGSRLAARALRDVKLFLSRAESLVVISINDATVSPANSTAQKLLLHITRSAPATTLIELTAEQSEIQPSILSLAADEDLDMLVMGAYGHSPLREGILGGVTREMLEAMTVPTLMSH